MRGVWKIVSGCERSRVAIRSKVSSGHLFNGFVKALHEGLRLKTEIEMSSSFMSTDLKTDATYFQQYGRSPGPPEKRIITKANTKEAVNTRPIGSFYECRRRKICHRYNTDWKPRHKCAPGSIRSNVQDRQRNGESSIHIVLIVLTDWRETPMRQTYKLWRTRTTLEKGYSSKR